ncbi:MAG: type III PLP-dependent enzyme [Actinobacteria bacterium]|nr:type III PLP-dependent enzyme [Actinomycetota bacterium]
MLPVASTPVPARSAVPTARIEAFLAEERRETPFLVVDCDVVLDRYAELRAAVPSAAIFYAVKANPAPELLDALVHAGSSFDVASPGEIDLALAAGADPAKLSYGNTIKKRTDIARAHELGVRMFAFDAADELAKLTAEAPGSTVFCRVLCDGAGSDWPLSRKFGCDVDQAVELCLRAIDAGHQVGVCFHVGSQQKQPDAYRVAIELVAEQIAAPLAAAGGRLSHLNVGGGFPGTYLTTGPATAVYGAVIERTVVRCFGDDPPVLITEPGRFLAADAGVIETEVVLVARKSLHDEHRWVFLDIGLFGGLAECLGEAIKYPIVTVEGDDGGPKGPVVLAGPTCDSADVLYEEFRYRLPMSLGAGDRLRLLATGAYTTTYAAVAFNGFPPLRTYHLPPSRRA